MIKVVFKKEREKGFNDTEFTYASYHNAEIGDIVVVETRYGYAIAKVTAINVVDERFDEDNLSIVKSVIESAAEQRIAQDRLNAQKALIKKIRRARIVNSIARLNMDVEDMTIIDNMTDDELSNFYEELTK